MSDTVSGSFKRLSDPEKPFRMTMSAPTESGKSYLLTHMLQHGLETIYDYIFVFCPSLKLNKDYKFATSAKYTFFNRPSESDVNEIFEKQTDCKEQSLEDNSVRCPRTLVIFDDCVDSKVLRFGGVVDKLAERGRHAFISIIITTQRMSAVSRSIRINSNYFVLFAPFSISEEESFIEQFVSRDHRKLVREQMRKVYTEAYRFILIDNREPDISKRLTWGDANMFINNKMNLLRLT